MCLCVLEREREREREGERKYLWVDATLKRALTREQSLASAFDFPFLRSSEGSSWARSDNKRTTPSIEKVSVVTVVVVTVTVVVVVVVVVDRHVSKNLSPDCDKRNQGVNGKSCFKSGEALFSGNLFHLPQMKPL